MHTIDSLNRAGAATAAARIAELEAEVARLRAIVGLGVEAIEERAEWEAVCCRHHQGPEVKGQTACGTWVLVTRAHVADCPVGRFLREAARETP